MEKPERKSTPRPIAALWNRLGGGMGAIVQDVSVAFGLRLLGAGLGFLFNLLLARFLGAEGAGVYFLAASVTMIAALVGR